MNNYYCKKMSKENKITISILLLAIAGIAVFTLSAKKANNTADNQAGEKTVTKEVNTNLNQPTINKAENIPAVPLSQAGQRVTKKPFGIFITPATSPVQPERFHGYHTGADFEILPGEENADVLVRAVCEGKLRVRQFVSGYGGVAIQDCQLGGENVTVLYGHLSLTSVKWEVGNEILESEVIGNLGEPAKGETDGERKHLHLAIHKGTGINYRGYVNSKNELSAWVDPCLYFCSPSHQN